jgi:UDP:flavonoid glycosyltransferase YjiC (YdhE family)
VPHLVVSISGHGFGHVAQIAPILNALHQFMPALRITVRSSVPLAHLHARIHAPFTHLPSDGDIGMMMISALEVDVEKSRAAYQKFHAEWNKRVADEAQLLRELKADFVFSNVGYLALAGAQLAGIQNAALCSLNWADIYRHYCGESEITAQIHACYANADAFFRATPGMAMSDLSNLIPVDPIAEIGTNRRDEINQKLNLSHDEKLVLVSMGGITSRLPIERWQRIEGVKWLVQQNWNVQHPDAIALETLQINFSDVLASCDPLLCKPGYGSFVEAACSGVPILYVNRPDWPEAPALVEWLQQHGVCLEISREELERGEVYETLREIWDAEHPKSIIPQGAMQVAEWLATHFG